jgi:hypothetical protein
VEREIGNQNTHTHTHTHIHTPHGSNTLTANVSAITDLLEEKRNAVAQLITQKRGMLRRHYKKKMNPLVFSSKCNFLSYCFRFNLILHNKMFAFEVPAERTLSQLWPASVGHACTQIKGKPGCEHKFQPGGRLAPSRQAPLSEIAARLELDADAGLPTIVSPRLAAHITFGDSPRFSFHTPIEDRTIVGAPCGLKRWVTPRVQLEETQLLEELLAWVSSDECSGLFTVDRTQQTCIEFDVRSRPTDAVKRLDFRNQARERLQALLTRLADKEMLVVVLGLRPFREVYITKIVSDPTFASSGGAKAMYATAVLDDHGVSSSSTPIATPPETPRFRVCFSPSPTPPRTPSFAVSFEEDAPPPPPPLPPLSSSFSILPLAAQKSSPLQPTQSFVVGRVTSATLAFASPPPCPPCQLSHITLQTSAAITSTTTPAATIKTTTPAAAIKTTTITDTTPVIAITSTTTAVEIAKTTTPAVTVVVLTSSIKTTTKTIGFGALQSTPDAFQDNTDPSESHESKDSSVSLSKRSAKPIESWRTLLDRKRIEASRIAFRIALNLQPTPKLLAKLGCVKAVPQNSLNRFRVGLPVM